MAKLVAEQVHFYLGAHFDQKKLQLAYDPTILAVTYDLENTKLLIKESRKKELIEELTSIRDTKLLSPGQAGKLKSERQALVRCLALGQSGQSLFQSVLAQIVRQT